MQTRFSKRRAIPDDPALARRAAILSERYDLPIAESVRWSTRQGQRWGSCTPSTGTVRISSRLLAAPGWVVDSVLVHELAHLLIAEHDERFHALVERFPRTERARGFLEAWGLAEDHDVTVEPVTGIDHVQLAMPPGGEDEATAFYAGLLGIPRVPKPEPLASRGGCWFERGSLRVHLGVEQDFRPARKAHPALAVQGLEELIAKLQAEGLTIKPGDGLEGLRQAYVDDPFGNRIELIERDA
jgi:catechol 2,3-dioxygenase-like lactoylglutathione lyase family enzyme